MNEKRIVECLAGIRVQLNWKRAFSEGWKITKGPSQSREILTNLYVPWYRNENGQEVGFNQPGALPTTVCQVAGSLGNWPQERQDAIYRYASAYQASGSAELDIPVYALPSGRHLILDGSHRAVALALAKIPIQLNMFIVEGPNEQDALPDLLHWQ